MTPQLSPAARVCLAQLRELYQALDHLRGTHDKAERVRVITQIRDACDLFLRLTE